MQIPITKWKQNLVTSILKLISSDSAGTYDFVQEVLCMHKGDALKYDLLTLRDR